MLECSESVTRALEIDPEEAEAHRIMGSIKMIEGDFQSGRYHHEKAKDLCPSDAYIAAKYATALIYMGEPEKALELMCKLIDDPREGSPLMAEVRGFLTALCQHPQCLGVLFSWCIFLKLGHIDIGIGFSGPGYEGLEIRVNDGIS